MAGKLTQTELHRFLDELASMNAVGVPLPEGLRELAQQDVGKRLKSVADSVAASTEKGASLSEALRASGSAPRELVALIECGESGGDLGGILDSARRQASLALRHREAALTAAIYPATVFVTLYGLLVFFGLSIAPMISRIYTRIGADVPKASKALFAILEWVASPLGLVVGALAIGFLAAVMLNERLRDVVFRARWAPLGMFPFIGLGDTLVVARSLSRLLAKGAVLPQALAAITLGVSQPANRRLVLEMSQAAAKGGSTADVFARFAPPMAAYLYRAGEERGDLAAACERIADHCEERYNLSRDRAIAALEPMLILIIGITLAAVFVFLYLPLAKLPGMIK